MNVFENTKIVPAKGGILREVIVGHPQSLNPLFSPLNDADRDITELIFCGLLKYNKEGEIIKDFTKDYRISKDGKTYEFTLKDNLFWSDGNEIQSDDIVFTIETLQSPEVQSPLRIIWREVKIEKVDKKTVKFILPHPYLPFLENFTLKILPAHIFKNIEPRTFFLKPPPEIVSSGPFQIREIEQDQENKITRISLDRNPYYQREGFLDEIEITFVDNEGDFPNLKDNSSSFAGIPPWQKSNFKESFNLYSLSLPRYFALFLNQNNKILSQKEIRVALALATPKEEIIKKVLLEEGREVYGPFLPENKIQGKIKKYDFNLDQAKKILDKAGWQDRDKNKIREKSFQEKKEIMPLKFNLYTIDQRELKETAKIIQETWGKIGVKINIRALEGEELRQKYISERKYDILLIGQGLYLKVDPYPFWHSLQKEYPGLNFSLYQNSEIDKLLETSREEINEEKREKMLQEIQQKITEDIPVIFLYSPHYLYAVKKEIKGIDGKYIIDPSKRFTNIENWYIFQKRVQK